MKKYRQYINTLHFTKKTNKNFLISYALALTSILYILFPSFYHSNLLFDVSPFLVLIPSVIISSLYGGLGPGLFATVIGLVIGNYFFTHPFNSFAIDNTKDVLREALFGISGILISVLSQLLHNALARAKKEANDARVSEERLKVIIEGTKDYAIFLLDSLGKIKAWNTPAEQIYGYTTEDVMGSHYRIFFTALQKEHDLPATALQTASREGKFDSQDWQLRKNKKKFWASLYITPTKETDGTIKGFVVVTRDRTQQKELENQKRTFLSVVAHELKTPIAILRVISQVLVDDYKKIIDKEILEDLNSELERLTILVEDLLDVSRIERGKLILAKQPFDVTAAISQVVDRMKLISHEHTISWKSPGSITINADETRIKQVLVNLISNAIKNSAKRTPITVTLQKEATGITISVIDQGIGISEEEQKNIFGMFYQVQEFYPKGFGLGLYISKEIVDHHHGRIWVNSEKGKGSTFSFFLPFV